MIQNKKIQFYKTLSPAEVSINMGHLARVLFDHIEDLTGFENLSGLNQNKRMSISVDKQTGFWEFEDKGRMHHPNIFKEALPKDSHEAKEMAMKYFLKKDREIQEDYHLKKNNFPRLFKYVNFINAYPVQHKSFLRIDHWVAIFNFSLHLKNNYRISLEQHELVIKLCNRGDVIGLKYHHIPILEENWVSPEVATDQSILFDNLHEKYENEANDLLNGYNKIIKDDRQVYENEIKNLKQEIKILKQELKNQKNNG